MLTYMEKFIKSDDDLKEIEKKYGKPSRRIVKTYECEI